jgi:hypothetical protein
VGRIVATVLVALVAASCAADHAPPPRPVTSAEARQTVDEMASMAAPQTAAAMRRLCALSRDRCAGFSGAVLRAPGTAPPAGHPPRVLCDRAAGAGARMVVVEGQDGLGRPYVSQIVLRHDGDGHDGDRVVPVREPAFWLGIGYDGPKVIGATSWSSAYTAGGDTDPASTATVLERARRACD